MSWLPISYPIDVVKTNVQVGGGTFLGETRRIWRAGGLGAFWDGVCWPLARAVINGAVTFLVVDNVCGLYLRRVM